jgi:hypothetical protein
LSGYSGISAPPKFDKKKKGKAPCYWHSPL